MFWGQSTDNSFKLKQANILIVDDERRYADMLARRLGLRGLVCEVCYDGRTALELLAENGVPVVILDLQLPDLYGVEVLRRIKTDYPKTAVVILTAHGTKKDRKACMALGAHIFMNKPSDIDYLLDTIRRIAEI